MTTEVRGDGMSVRTSDMIVVGREVLFEIHEGLRVEN